MEDNSSRIAEVESQIAKLQTELTALKKDQPRVENHTKDFLHSKIFLDLCDEIERGEWSPGGKYWEKF